MHAAITIDVDSLRFYRAIHGLPAAETGPDPIYTTAVPRFFELLDEAGLSATLFLIGQDAPAYPDAWTAVATSGSEVASHSFSHDYQLSLRSEADIEDDLARAEAALAPLSPTGRVVGFRAPGYNVSPRLLEVVRRRGYAYDSSMLPAPVYWATRAAAIARYAAVGRPSASMFGHPLQFAGPLGPYRMAPRAAWRPAPSGLVELPMAVHPTHRLPLIGTSWVLLPRWLRYRWLRQALDRLPLFNFEMHAIDLLDPTDDGVPVGLAAVQPDLRVSAVDKMTAFRTLFRAMAEQRIVLPLNRIAASVPSA